jgi:hypothetical protein
MMGAKFRMLITACGALLLSACASQPKSQIIGKWEVASASVGGAESQSAAEAARAIKMTAEFGKDGTAKITMFGRTLQGTYKLNGDNELEWTMGGITTKSKAIVTTSELELTDDANRTIKYRRK